MFCCPLHLPCIVFHEPFSPPRPLQDLPAPTEKNYLLFHIIAKLFKIRDTIYNMASRSNLIVLSKRDTSTSLHGLIALPLPCRTKHPVKLSRLSSVQSQTQVCAYGSANQTLLLSTEHLPLTVPKPGSSILAVVPREHCQLPVEAGRDSCQAVNHARKMPPSHLHNPFSFLPPSVIQLLLHQCTVILLKSRLISSVANPKA